MKKKPTVNFGITNSCRLRGESPIYNEKGKTVTRNYIITHDFDDTPIEKVKEKIELLKQHVKGLGPYIIYASNAKKSNYWFVCFSVVPFNVYLESLFWLNGCKGYRDRFYRDGRNTLRFSDTKPNSKLTLVQDNFAVGIYPVSRLHILFFRRIFGEAVPEGDFNDQADCFLESVYYKKKANNKGGRKHG
jgi:hypothetical protein